MSRAMRLLFAGVLSAALIFGLTAFSSQLRRAPAPFDRVIENQALTLLEEGRNTFRYDTFGDEAFWGGALRLHESIRNVSPRTALTVGLKVDADALSRKLIDAIRRGAVDLDDPAVTLQLLRLNAVVGVTGFFSGSELTSIGIQCAFCHSTVDNGVAPGIGHRLDGWANRDLDVGAIIALAPNLAPFTTLLGVDEATVRNVLASWGPGKFDAELILDGKAFRPDGKPAATLIPPAFGLAGVNLHTWTGWGSVTHWNAFVANLEMHGSGTFFDPRLNDAERFPIAAREGFGNVRNQPDLITSKLSALHVYQLAIPAPKPPEGSFDAALAQVGAGLFSGKARCATCHVPPLFTEPGWNMHRPEEIGIDAFQADRSPDRHYRTAPLKGLWTHMKGGFYHDGRFATLREVLDHYDGHLTLGLSDDEKRALEEYLKSLGDRPVAGTSFGKRPGAASASVRPLEGSGGRGAVFEIDLASAGSLRCSLYDVQGRHVARLLAGQPFEPGVHRISWNGVRDDGTPAPRGIYFARFEGPLNASAKFVLSDR